MYKCEPFGSVPLLRGVGLRGGLARPVAALAMLRRDDLPHQRRQLLDLLARAAVLEPLEDLVRVHEDTSGPERRHELCTTLRLHLVIRVAVARYERHATRAPRASERALQCLRARRVARPQHDAAQLVLALRGGPRGEGGALPGWPKPVESATLKAASSSPRGSSWEPCVWCGPPPLLAECRAAESCQARQPWEGAGAEAEHCQWRRLAVLPCEKPPTRILSAGRPEAI